MKKIFTLIAAAALTLTAGAQNYRHWDFTQWSNTTIDNLQADAAASSTEGWSDIEKVADAGEGKVAPEATAGKCFWLTDPNGGELKANGAIIAETEGLIFNSAYTTKRSLAIAVNYPSTTLGTYAGPQYLWLGGGKNSIACFTIPNVRVGQKITMTVESHKPAEARGVAIYVGAVDDSHKIGDSFTPTTQDTYTWEDWTLPEASSLNDDGETVDVIVYNTNGCHIYDIEVGTSVEKAKVAYIYGGDVNNDLVWNSVKSSDKYEFTTIEATATLSLNDIADYSAVIISSTVSDAAALAHLKELQPFVPTLCLNPAVYEAWGDGTLVEAATMGIELKNKDHALFRNLEVMEEDGVYALVLTGADAYQAVTLNGRFANDAVLATVYGAEDVAIHGHNLSHNAYLYLPACTQETFAQMAAPALLDNAIQVVVGSKAKVTQATKPAFTLTYKDRQTIVSMKSTTAGAQVYYTTDGTVPTTASTLYTEPLTVTTEGVTIKAVAIAEGYMLSDVAEQAIDLKNQAPTPTFAVENQSGSSIVTISSTQEGASIYYNFSGSNDVKASALYTEPVTVTQLGRVIYAFAQAEGCVDSELAQQVIVVNDAKVRIDVVAHMDANKDTYFPKGDQNKSSVSYFFSWGKDKAAYPYWNVEEGVVEEVVTDSLGNENIVKTYTVLSPEEEVDFENGWAVRSRGQLCMWESGDFKNDVGDTNYRNPATVDDVNTDFPFTNNFITLADKNTTPDDGQAFPYNAYIISTQKFQGPFDIVANIGNGAGDVSKLDIVLQVAADGNQLDSQWQVLGDTVKIVNGRRLIRNITRSYEGTDEVYVRAYLAANNSKAQFYDIYIANEGEKSLQRKQEFSGIMDAEISNLKSQTSNLYDLQGRRLNGVPTKGIYIKNGRKFITK